MKERLLAMSFTALPRVSNFSLKALKGYLALYPEIENDLEWRNTSQNISWDDAKTALESKMNGYKRSYYQQAVIWGLEDRSNDKVFDYQRYLLMFQTDEQLKKYCEFWFKTYYAPNLHVQYEKDKDEKPVLIFCEFAHKILASDNKRINFKEVLSEICGAGKSEDIVFNCFKNWGTPIKTEIDSVRQIWYLFVDAGDVAQLELLVRRIETSFAIDKSQAFDENYYFKRFSYKNYAKFWNIKESAKDFAEFNGAIKLPSTVKERAKAVVDYIYKLDGFERIEDCFEIADQSIKIKTKGVDDLFPDGNWLRYMFVLPTSDMYDISVVEGKTRVFEDDYVIKKDGLEYKCRLTTEWVGKNIEPGMQGNNYLPALIRVVNKYYKDVLHITKQAGEYYLCRVKKDFKFAELPKVFQNDFARRYVTSLLAKPFVILTGNSGTGKTRIAKQFAEYLEVEDDNGDKNWLIVPVGADWTDNAKILGFYNPLAKNGTGSYEKTGILKLIEAANINSDKPYFIILDEMNLSHVERYFSDFLSHMETPDSPFKMDGYEGGELKYPDNLFIVGTVNIDETTYMFSPKVLDRANVVEFKPEKDAVMELFGKVESDERVTSAKDGSAEAFLQLAKEIRNGMCNIESADPDSMNQIRDVFSKVYDVVAEKDFEFAFRTVREVLQYISAAYEISGKDKTFSFDQAIDEQILQKIMTKIHGNRKEIGALLDKMEKICKNETEIRFVLSLKKIEQMKGKLDSVQYASFI